MPDSNQPPAISTQSLHTVTCTLPEFWQDSPELYLVRIESVPYSFDVTKELAKYHKLAEALPASVFTQVQSLPSNLSADAPNSTMRAEILQLKAVSDRQPYHQLIKALKPSPTNASSACRHAD
ncbi:hypothetical protein SprV_0100274600 [Sparganum proliferum]